MKSTLIGLLLFGFAVSAQQPQIPTTPPTAPGTLTGVALTCKNITGYFEVVHFGTTLWSKAHYRLHLEFLQGKQGLKLYTNYGDNSVLEMNFEDLHVTSDGDGYYCHLHPQECLEETASYIGTLTLAKDRTVGEKTTNAAHEAITCALMRITNFHKEIREKLIGQPQ